MIPSTAMPWSIVVRLLSRLVLLGVLGRAVSGQRRAYGFSPPARQHRPFARPDSDRAQRVRRALSAAADPARLVGRIVGMAVFWGASATLLAAGTTLTTLGPRWLGIPLLVLAALAFLAGAIEARAAVRIRLRMRRRGAADRLLPPSAPPTVS